MVARYVAPEARAAEAAKAAAASYVAPEARAKEAATEAAKVTAASYVAPEARAAEAAKATAAHYVAPEAARGTAARYVVPEARAKEAAAAIKPECTEEGSSRCQDGNYDKERQVCEGGVWRDTGKTCRQYDEGKKKKGECPRGAMYQDWLSALGFCDQGYALSFGTEYGVTGKACVCPPEKAKSLEKAIGAEIPILGDIAGMIDMFVKVMPLLIIVMIAGAITGAFRR